MILASFFGSFVLYIALGLGALVLTVVLDKALGKERALLLAALGIVGLTWAMKPVAPSPQKPAPQGMKFTSSRNDPSAPVKPTFEPFSREPLGLGGERNAFQEMSDTNPLPPENLREPDAVSMPFPLPPTVPGVGFAARGLYRGTLPTVAAPAAAGAVGPDGMAPASDAKVGEAKPAAALPELPADGFSSYVESPDDVYDSFTDGGSKVYFALRAIDEAKAGTPGFEDAAVGLKWMLEGGEAPPGSSKVWSDLSVSFSYVGSEADARKKLDRTSQVKVKQSAPSSIAAGKHEKWHLRNSVDNQFVRACRRQGRAKPEDLGVDQLKAVAAEMAKVGEKGQENGLGWQKAIDVLKLALAKCKQPPVRDATDVLLALIDAYRARQVDKDLVATLTAYMASAKSGNATADAQRWFGDVFLSRFRLAQEAVAFYDQAVAGQSGSRGSFEGRGDAKSYLGLHADALKDYRAASDAGGRPTAAVREAEALLRLGKLAEAKTAADAALGAGAFDPRALLVKGAVQYAMGDVRGAADTFRQVCVLPSDESTRRHRAEALYNLGLCEWRMGHTETAAAAFDAVEAALRRGSARGRSLDETVSPELGRALIQLSAGNLGEAHDALDRARDLAPGVAHVEFVAGWIASTRKDPVEARTRLEAARALAPELYELDGWLAEARLAGAEAAVGRGTPPGDLVQDFEAAARYAERASRREAETNPKNADFALREAGVRLRQLQLSERKRFEAALKTAEAILAKAREERRALAIKGYCNYRLGVGEPERYGECLRNFQAIIDLPSGPNDALKKYAQECLDIVKRWQALEEKTLEFDEMKLATDWDTGQSHGIRVNPDNRALVLKDLQRGAGATDDGSETDPTAFARNRKLVNKDSLELVQLWVKIPTKNASGEATNNILCGLVLQPPSQPKGGLVKGQGIGIFYDKGRVSARITGGNNPYYKDGQVRRAQRNGAEIDWPEDKGDLGVLVEIERTAADGSITVRVGGQEVVSDTIATFRRAKGDLELWFGGWSTKSQNWDVAVEKIRIVRRRP